jgi:RNA polymerase sigma-70 factor (ECF subfamily)
MVSPVAAPAHPDRTGMTDSQQAHFAELTRRVAADRDPTAFAELFDHFAPRINAFLMRQGTPNGLAEEIAQDTMIVLWNKAHLFDPSKSSASTWLFRVARNRRIDLIRRDKSDRIDPNDPIFHPSPMEAPDEEMDAVSRDERVREAMKTLRPEQFELIRQAFFQGLSHSEIAEQSGLPLGTVKSRIRLAFKKLRDALEADPKVDVG